MTYDCMTPAELTLWQEAAIYEGQPTAKKPCVDCPMWFHLEEKAAGRCHSKPMPNGGRPPLPDFEHLFKQSPGRGHRYEFEDERVAARRQTWRDYKRRLRASQAPRIGAQS